MKLRKLLLPAVLAALAAVLLSAPGAAAADPPSKRIVGGQANDISSWTYLVAIREAGGESFCGGSLIRRDLVLTAAHCVTDDAGNPLDPSSWEVVAGRTDLTDEFSGDVQTVFDTFVHPYYDPSTAAYDVALIELNDFVSVIDTANLVEVDDGTPGWAFGDQVWSAGWGLTIPGDDTSGSETQLKDVLMTTRSDSECLAALGSDYDPDSMMCAGVPPYTADDTCQGDSGGPLVVDHNPGPQDDVQVGIVSWGDGCAAGSPGAYSYLAAPLIRFFIFNPNWNGSLPSRPRPQPAPRPAPRPSARCTRARASVRRAKRKLRRAKRKLRAARRAYRRRPSARNRRRVRRAKRSYRRAKRAYRRALRRRRAAC